MPKWLRRWLRAALLTDAKDPPHEHIHMDHPRHPYAHGGPGRVKLPWDVVSGMRVIASTAVQRGTIQVHPDDLAIWRLSSYAVHDPTGPKPDA